MSNCQNPPETRAEKLILLAIVCLFAASALYILPVFPVQVDEINYADPAASLFFGHGFASGTWFAQHSDTFWASNLPLYPFALSQWMKLFGCSPLAVRSLSLFLEIVGTLALWSGIVRRNCFPDMKGRLMVVVLLLASFSTINHLVMGRPDSLTTCIACLLWWAASLSTLRVRLAVLFFLGFLAAMAGLQLVTFIIFSSAIVVGFYRLTYWKEILSVALGGVGGAALLVWVYSSNGVLETFIGSVAPVVVGAKSGYLSSQTAKHHWGGLLDYSYILLLPAAALAAYAHLRASSRNSKSLSLALFAYLVAVPALTGVAGMYPVYYGWMATLPATVLIVLLIQTWPDGNRKLRLATLACVFLSALVAYPRVFCNALRFRNDLVNESTQSFISPLLRDNEVALISRQAFYAVRPKAKTLFYLDHSPWRMDRMEKDALSLIVMSPDEFGRVHELIGGNWIQSGNVLVLPNRVIRTLPTSSEWHKRNSTITLAAFRRAPAGSP